MTDEEIRTEILLDHYRNPHNYGQIDEPSVKMAEYNPVCGDTIQITLKIEGGTVVDARFIGRGCSISQGTTSMLMDRIKGQKIDEIKKISKEDVLEMLGLRLGPSREKCALLSLNTLNKCLDDYEEHGGKKQ